MIVKIRLPKISKGRMSNLIGFLGLALIVVSIGGLTNIWYAMIATGIFSVGIAYILYLEELDDQSTAVREVTE